MFYLNKKSIFFQVFILLFVSEIFPQKQLRVGYINMDYILANLDDYNMLMKSIILSLICGEKRLNQKIIDKGC